VSCTVSPISKPENTLQSSAQNKYVVARDPFPQVVGKLLEKRNAEGLSPRMGENVWVIHNISIMNYSRAG
jgi:hypothetical protein